MGAYGNENGEAENVERTHIHKYGISTLMFCYKNQLKCAMRSNVNFAYHQCLLLKKYSGLPMFSPISPIIASTVKM